MKIIFNKGAMRTPVIVVAGQGDTEAVMTKLLGASQTLAVDYGYDGEVVRRIVRRVHRGAPVTVVTTLELVHGCMSCTIRKDLLIRLRQWHRCGDAFRIVVRLPVWLEPEPICDGITEVVVTAPGLPAGPAAMDVEMAAVVTCVDSARWLDQALGLDHTFCDDLLGDGRIVAQVVVGQAEVADVLVLTTPEPNTLAVLRRLAPRARITVGIKRVEAALAHLDSATRRGRRADPHGGLLAGEPPLHAERDVQLLEFSSRHPFHPERFHAALGLLLDGVVRIRGRIWLANRAEDCMWIESAGAGVRIDTAGRWLAAMSPGELANVDAERRVLGELMWCDDTGDRHTSITVLVCGAQPARIQQALETAVLTDEELATPRRWSSYSDPFGNWHEDPCDDLPDLADESSIGDQGRGRRDVSQ